MAEQSEKEKREQKRKRNRLIRLCIILAIILSVALLIWINWTAIRDFADKAIRGTTETVEGFPVVAPSGSSYSMTHTETKLLLLTDNYLYVYSTAGKQLLTLQHSLTEPAIFSAEGWCILYEPGETDLIVVNLTALTYERHTLEAEISFACCSEDGRLCLIQSGSRFVSELRIYDSRMTELYCWQTQNLLMSADFYSQNMIAVLSADTHGGMIVSTITVIDIRQEEFAAEVPIQENLLLSVDCKPSGEIVAVGDQGVVSIGPDGYLQGEYSFENELLMLTDNTGDGVLLILGDYDTFKSTTAIMLDASLNVLGTEEITDRITNISADGNRSAILLQDALLYWDGKSFETEECGYGNLEAEMFDGDILLRTSKVISVFE